MALIKLLVEGGKMTPGPAVAQQLGPMGINLGEVISQVNDATKDFKGVTVPVHLDVDGKTKEFSIKVLSPPTSELIKKELGIEKFSGARIKEQAGNLSIEQVIAVAKSKHDSLLSRDFLASVTSVIGTCLANGVLIESKDPKEVLAEVKSGVYDDQISSQKTDTDPEKKKELDSFFAVIAEKQDAARKVEEAKAESKAKKK
jgi:large subunit ribosomal protein L11